MHPRRARVPVRDLARVSCDCGCTGLEHLECELRGKTVPSGVVRHLGVGRHHKLNSIHDMHMGAHLMDDDELLFQLSCYDDVDCPAPDNAQLRLLRYQAIFEEAQPFPSDLAGWTRWPVQALGWRAGEGVR